MKKRIKRKLNKGRPLNYTFWCWTLEKPEEVNEFIERGDKGQKDSIRLVLQYMKKIDPEKFDRVNGAKIIKTLNEQEQK